MAYLRLRDYYPYIQSTNLTQIVGLDPTARTVAEAAAEEEVSGYLVQKYDTEREFRGVTTWDVAKAYKAGDLVEDSLGALYYAQYPSPYYNYKTQYIVGDKVFWKDKEYTALVPNISTFPDDLNSQIYWGTGVAYSITAGTVLIDTTKWTLGDNRSQQLVRCVVDVSLYHIHSRIAPQNIPKLREDRYAECVKWLLEASGANNAVTAKIPLLQPKQGNRIRYGGNQRNTNVY